MYLYVQTWESLKVYLQLLNLKLLDFQVGFYVDDESIFIKNKFTNYEIILNYTSVTV